MKPHCEMEILDFTKNLFQHFRSFNAKEIPDISNINALKDLPGEGIYKDVFDNLKKFSITKIFTDNKAIVNKYLHTEYMLYYDLTKEGTTINWPVYFGSYKEMCSSCQELWAKATPFKAGQYNVICFCKVTDGKHRKNIDDKSKINKSCLQFYKNLR